VPFFYWHMSMTVVGWHGVAACLNFRQVRERGYDSSGVVLVMVQGSKNSSRLQVAFCGCVC
jgi:hypothetical protein